MIFDLPGAGYRSAASERRSKHWIKRLERVDRTIADGYAFIGKFARFSATEEAPVGTHYLAYAEYRRGSGQVDGRTVTLYRVTEDGLTEVDKWEAGAERGWALRVRDAVADHLEVPNEDKESLLEEKERLLARLKEIDALLA